MLRKVGQIVVLKNKKAYFDYFIEDTLEAGVVLEGKEVKSIRQGKCNLKGSWCSIDNGEAYVKGMHISPYQDAGEANLVTRVDPYRVRKLLLHKAEIRKLQGKLNTVGYTFVPLELYFSNGKVKLKIGICRGKKQYDKREAIKKRDIERDMKRVVF